MVCLGSYANAGLPPLKMVNLTTAPRKLTKHNRREF
jgi:hypothetical protein